MAAETSPHLERLLTLGVSPAGRLLALAGERDAVGVSESVVTLLQLPKLKPSALAPHERAVTALTWLPGERLLTGTLTGQLLLWETRPPETRKGKSKGDEEERLARLVPLFTCEAHVGAVRALCVDPLGRGIFSVGDDGRLLLHRLSPDPRGQLLQPVGARVLSEQPLRCVVFQPSEQRTVLEGQLAVGGDDGVLRTLLVRDDINTSALREVAVGEGGITALCFMEDDRIAVGSADGALHFCFWVGAPDLELRSGETPHAGAIRGLLLSPALEDEAGRPLARRLLSVGQEGSVRAWPLDTRRAPRTLELGRALTPTAMTWQPAPAKVDRALRGGMLFVATRERSVLGLSLTDEGLPPAEAERVGSELDRLAELLQARAAKVHLAALEALTAIPEDEARLLLERGLDASSPDVRMAAARALAQSGRRLSRPRLRQALRDGRADVRAVIFEALLALEGPGQLSPLKVALSSPHVDLRLKAVQLLPALASRSLLVVNLLVERLHDAEEKVRLQALEGLLLSRAPQVEAIRLAVERGPADVGVAALTQLMLTAEHPSVASRQLLLEGLKHRLQPVRELAGELLLTLQPALLLAVLKRDPALLKRFSTLDALRRRQSPSAVPLLGRLEEELEPKPLTDEALEPLFALLACADPLLALQGAGMLASLGDGRAVGALLQLSREAQPTLRRRSVEGLLAGALALPDDERLLQRLEWLLDDPVAEVRATSFQALQTLVSAQGASGVWMLGERALRSSQADIRARAVGVLAVFGGSGALASLEHWRVKAEPLLVSTLHDEAKEARHEAFRILLSWYAGKPETALRVAAGSVHADIRSRVVEEAARLKAPFTFELLLARVKDVSASVGLAAYQALRDDKTFAEQPAIHAAAFEAPPWEVRAEACRACPVSCVEVARLHLPARVREPEPRVHLPAIEAADRLIPMEQEAFAEAFSSIFYLLRVRAGELAGIRRDLRAVEPMLALLHIPPTQLNYPAPELRQRAARALADVGDPEALPACVRLLQDPDGLVREQAARALANAARPGEEQLLVDALSHADLAVRSWAAEGLARLGDVRALPTLIGTLKHPHLPVRKGAVVALTALGAEGVSGLLQGLEDADASLQSLVLSVLVARDVALCRAGEAPDLLLNALAASKAELRFAAARALEVRLSDAGMKAYEALALELLSPVKPEKSADLKDWPVASKREAFLRALLAGLASDRPSQRYAAAQVLLLREQPLAFWAESKRMSGLQDSARPFIPFTSWSEETRQERRVGWIRQLVSRPRSEAQSQTERVLTVLRFAGAPRARAVPAVAEKRPDKTSLLRLVFGTYAGLVRQLPESGQAQEGHPVRRDSLERLVALAELPEIGRTVVLPLLQLGLQDGHYLVRRAAAQALQTFFPAGQLEPFSLMLRSSAEDMGRAGLEGLLSAFEQATSVPEAEKAGADKAEADKTGLSSRAQEARARVVAGLEAPHPEVRATVLARLGRLYPASSLEPWLLGLRAPHADVRRSALDRLLQALDARQAQAGSASAQDEGALERALSEALSSEHEDLRLKAAVALAARGEGRAVEVLGLALRSEEHATVERALLALQQLALRQPTQVEPVAETLVSRLEDDPNKTAPRAALLTALGKVGARSAADALWRSLEGEDVAERRVGFASLVRLGLSPRRTELQRAELQRAELQRAELQRAELQRPSGEGAAWRTLAVGLEPLPPLRLLFEEPEAFAILQRLAQSPQESIREKVASLLYHLDLPACEGLLLRLVQDRASSVRVAACEAARLRVQRLDEASVVPLQQALRSGRRELVLPAARGLAVRQKQEALQPLLLVLKAGEVEEKPQALLSLVRLGDRRVLPELKALLVLDETATPEQLRLAELTYEALGALLPALADEAQQEIRTLLEDVLHTGSAVNRLSVLRGLRHAGDDKSRVLLEKVALSAQESREARSTALMGLVWLGEPGTRPVFEQLVQGAELSLAEQALEGLLGLARSMAGSGMGSGVSSGVEQADENEGVLGAYLTALGSPHEVLQGRAVEWLAREARPEVLLETLASPARGKALHRSSVHAASLRARLRQGLLRRGWEAGERLVPLLEGELPSVRAEAAWLVGGLPGTSARGLAVGLEKGLVQWREASRALLLRQGWPSLETRSELEALRRSERQPALLRVVDVVEALDALVWALERRGGVEQHGEKVKSLLFQLAQEERLPGFVVTRVKRLLGDTEGEERARVAKLSPGLQGLLRPEAVPGLLALVLKGGATPARLEGLAALGRLGTSEARQALEQVLAHAGEPEEVRKTAFRALRRLTRREASYARGA